MALRACSKEAPGPEHRGGGRASAPHTGPGAPEAVRIAVWAVRFAPWDYLRPGVTESGTVLSFGVIFLTAKAARWLGREGGGFAGGRRGGASAD